ncbi:Uncharacterised protein [Klebsiella michiganensis]|uniref:Uncharacterized protein n=1 Tax=Klebsiella michiganensis TaxID=1134687 RepID=A0A7H4PGS0_9ENTR|nr:Uncharacterised protein [Klebsiella michiganensis]
MRDRSHISNISDAETSGVQCTNSRFATWTRTFDHNFQILDTVFFYGFQRNALLQPELQTEWICENHGNRNHRLLPNPARYPDDR